MRSVQLQQDFGILGNTTETSTVLEGTIVSPEGSIQSLVGMLKMIAEVAVGVKDRMFDIVITHQEYTKYYTVYREKISSYVSGLHFGHWKAASSSNRVAEFHATLTKMVLQP